ncbi:leucine-rich repeat-containing protein 1-like [Atheta coriaria]|uniref:leucine-rich repeat-containing protein 1-like n=1 Tax=Dalotia coriaria TaxID=877792 RepID=UPI0031F37FFF
MPDLCFASPSVSTESVEKHKITIVSIPIKPGEPYITLVSNNTNDDLSTNGYEQFEIRLTPQTGHFIRDISSNIINLDYTRIRALSLRNCKLKELPNDLHLLNLLELDLMDNSLNSVPECLYLGLKNIQVLNLADNPIKNFPIAPKCVESLKILNLENCMLNNLPIWIEEMKTKSLEELYFSKNKVSYLKRSDLPQLIVKLKKIVFNNVGLRQHMLDFFKSFPLLQYLDISNCDSDQKNINAFNDINELFNNALWYRHIKILKLINLHIAELSSNVCKLIHLKELHLKHNLLLNIPANIYNLQNLMILGISHNCIYSLPDLSSLQSLEELHASKNHLSTINLTNMPRLKYIDLYDNELENIEITSLEIECIDVEQNYIDADALLNHQVDNYEERRESLRSRRAVAFEWRAIGRKLGGIELDSPIDDDGLLYQDGDVGNLHDDDVDDSDCYSDARYSDNGDEGRLHRDTYKIEDDDCSDWGETGPHDLVTLSDSEFFPEDAPIVPLCTKNSFIESIHLEDLFIDAD